MYDIRNKNKERRGSTAFALCLHVYTQVDTSRSVKYMSASRLGRHVRWLLYSSDNNRPQSHSKQRLYGMPWLSWEMDVRYSVNNLVKYDFFQLFIVHIISNIYQRENNQNDGVNDPFNIFIFHDFWGINPQNPELFYSCYTILIYWHNFMFVTPTWRVQPPLYNNFLSYRLFTILGGVGLKTSQPRIFSFLL